MVIFHGYVSHNQRVIHLIWSAGSASKVWDFSPFTWENWDEHVDYTGIGRDIETNH